MCSPTLRCVVPDANKHAIGSVPGVFDVVVRAMRRHEGVAEVQHVATATLCHLVTYNAGTLSVSVLFNHCACPGCSNGKHVLAGVVCA